MRNLITQVFDLPRLAPFEMTALPLTIFAATIAPDGRRYISNTGGIFVAPPGSLEFTRLVRREDLSIKGWHHRLQHDHSGGIYFSVRHHHRLYRMPPGETRFHVVCESLGGMVRGFDYHQPSGLLLAGRYALSGPAQLFASRDGESWSLLHQWDARHVHDVRVNPANDWIYVLVGEGDPRATADSHAIYRSKDGSHFVRLFKSRRPFFLPVNFYKELVILGTDHPEGGNGIYGFEDDGGDGPVVPEPLFHFPEAHQGLANHSPVVHFLEWFHGSLFAGVRGNRLGFLLRTNNLRDWELVHLSGFPKMEMAYVNCSRPGEQPFMIVSGQPGLLIAEAEPADLYGVPFIGRDVLLTRQAPAVAV